LFQIKYNGQKKAPIEIHSGVQQLRSQVANPRRAVLQGHTDDQLALRLSDDTTRLYCCTAVRLRIGDRSSDHFAEARGGAT
jgi:hypothetical protein